MTVETPQTLTLDEADGASPDRRASEKDRRDVRRSKTLKGAEIWPVGGPVRCIVRNLSAGGACLEVEGPVPDIFEVIFDSDKSRRKCRVCWRKDSRLGVAFQD